MGQTVPENENFSLLLNPMDAKEIHRRKRRCYPFIAIPFDKAEYLGIGKSIWESADLLEAMDCKGGTVMDDGVWD